MRIVKQVSFIFVLLLSVSGAIFANDATADVPITETIWAILSTIIDFASWIWVLLAIIAGKVMTNDLVYGEFLGFDNILWQMRVVSRQISTFAIGWLFLFYVLQFLFKPDETTPSFIKQKLWYLILGWVLIQVSWFGIGAIMDIQTITTAAVWSMPTSLFNQMPDLQQVAVSTSAHIQKKYVYSTNSDSKTPAIVWQGEKGLNDTESIMDLVNTSTETLSWILIWLWSAIFSFQDYSSLDVNQASSLTSSELPWYIATVFIKFGVIVMYAWALLLLVLINIFRLVTLWILIPFSPFLILIGVYKAWWGSTDAGSQLWIGSFVDILKLIFAPTVFTAALWFSLIVILTFVKLMNVNDNVTLNNGITIKIDSEKQVLDSELASVEFSGELWEWFSKSWNAILTDLLIVGMALALIWFIVKLSIDMLPDNMMWKKTVQSAQSALWTAAWNVPLIPIPWMWTVWVNTAIWTAQRWYSDFSRKLSTNRRNESARFSDKINSALWINNGITQAEKADIETLAVNKWTSNMTDYISQINKNFLSQEKATWWNIYALDKWFATHYKDIVKSQGLSTKNKIDGVDSIKSYIDSSVPKETDKRKLLEYLHTSFGGTGNNPLTYEDFAKRKYGVETR